MNVLVGGIYQETNTFSGIQVTYDDFRRSSGDGVIKALPECQLLIDAGFTVVPAVYARIIPSAPLSKDEFILFTEAFLASVADQEVPDAIYLNLHGGMYVNDIGSGELYLLKCLRQKFGESIPIFASFDFHGNMFPGLADLLNYATAYKTAPHVDVQETRERAVNALIKCLQEQIVPRVKCIQLPMTFPGEMVITDDYPAREILKMAEDIVIDGLALEVSWFCGFVWSDADEIFMSFAVSAASFDEVLVKRIKVVVDRLWELRHTFRFSVTALPCSEAVELALSASEDTRKVFVSDSGDNMTAGASGDSAYMVGIFDDVLKKNPSYQNRRLLMVGIVDGQAVESCLTHKSGDQFMLRFGGERNPRNQSASYEVSLVRSGSFGMGEEGSVIRYAIVRCGLLEILLNDSRFAYTEIKHFEDVEINLDDYHIICVKLGYLYPELAVKANQSILAFSPGDASLDVMMIPYQKGDRQFFPRCDVDFDPRINW